MVFRKRKGNLTISEYDSKWGYQVASSLLRGKDITPFEPRSSHAFMFEKRWYKVAVIRKIKKIIASFEGLDPFVLKRLIFQRIGLFNLDMIDDDFKPSISFKVQRSDGRLYQPHS